MEVARIQDAWQTYPMPDWKQLSIEDRKLVEDNLMRALNHLGIEGTVTRWDKPTTSKTHWRLSIQTSWCGDKAHEIVALILEQALTRAGIEAPRRSINLCGQPNL